MSVFCIWCRSDDIVSSFDEAAHTATYHCNHCNADGTHLVIEGVAVRVNQQVFALPRPNRHCDVYEQRIRQIPEYDELCTFDDGVIEGFVLTDGTFVDRQTAMKHAVAIKQVDPKDVHQPTQLFSEDVW